MKISKNAQKILYFIQLKNESSYYIFKEFFIWLNSYHNLFQIACKQCGKMLFRDSIKFQFLPPTYRTIDGLPFHNSCILE